MFVGLVIVAVLFTHFAQEFNLIHGPEVVLRAKPLEIVSYGLVYAAGFELAYMLFTDGPDEVIHPVTLGLASAVLLILSDDAFDWRDALIVPLLCGSIAILFFVDERFVKPIMEVRHQRRVPPPDVPNA
jgi:hypothetical protein